jgi:hypothetical protein
MSLWKKDPDGDDSLIIDKQELADAIKDKQQDLDTQCTTLQK